MKTELSKCVLLSAICLASALEAALAPVPVPDGTKAKASFLTEDDGSPMNLLDGNPTTSMRGRANSCKDALDPVWVDIVFPSPVLNLAGVETGKSDQFHNYYPKAAQFWADTDGNGTYDTCCASVKLGPSAQCAGRHLFGGRVPKTYALRFLVTEQNKTGLSRGFMLDGITLLADPAAKPLAATPEKTVDAVIRAAADARDAQAKAAAEERRRNAPKPDQSIVPGAEKMPGRILPLPSGTTFRTSRRTEGGKGAECLFDGDPGTWLGHAGNTCRNSDDAASVILSFPSPLADIGGIETGESDSFHNYYPREFEFWADSDGDSRCDTFLGRTRALGPAAKCVGRHRFEGRLQKVYALEIRAVDQHVGGGHRAYTMNEMRLVADPTVPLVKATPRGYLSTTYVERLPKGTTADVSVSTEENGGADKLLDDDPTTFLNPVGGTAREGKSVSVFLRFPKAVAGVCGIELGQTDPYRNYVWEEMDFYADTTGDGVYDTLSGHASGGAPGRKRFTRPLEKAYGIELRVTKQSLKGVRRAFKLNGINGLIFQDDPGEGLMRVVLEDFEDLSSWRTWAVNTAQPEGERYYGGYTYICGVLDGSAPSGCALGKMRYCFKPSKRPGKKDNWMRAKRGTVSAREAFMDRIEFMANPQGYPCEIQFQVVDSAGKLVFTPTVELSGKDWRRCSIDLTPKSWPTALQLTPPLRIENIWMRSAEGGTGDVLLDDIAAIGFASRDQRVAIRPVWDGLACSPDRPLVLRYLVRNALDRELNAPMKAVLYSAYDPRHEKRLAEKVVAVKIPKWGEIRQSVDFGVQPYGQYEVELKLQAEGVAAECLDFASVARLNGGRVNKSPMWIGSQHPGSWISDAENKFVFKQVVAPLGLDCYRTGAPGKDVVDSDLLLAAGFGGLPPHLQQKNVKRPDIGEPNDYAAYEDWVREEAKKKYAPYVDRILAVEYYNEPDLPGFCYMPEIDTYLKMWRTWANGMRAGAPGIKLGTGGNTVQHAREKKDFNSRMYTELAQEADVAIWHAHGPLGNYSSRHQMVENWLEKGGRAKARQLLGNTEAGTTSNNSPVERLRQADCLVRKIGWAKAQGNSLYYLWFTTTDTYDPQGGYLGGENWGLVAPNQRLKPSGLAMNELIRQLANTEGRGEVVLDSRLQTCHFVCQDGESVYLSWPRETGAELLLPLSANGPVELCDLFGRREVIRPQKGRLTIRTNGWPFYLRIGAGTVLSQAKAPEGLVIPEVVGVRPESEAKFTATVVYAARPLTAYVEDLAGKTVATAKANAGVNVRLELAFSLPAGMKAGSRGYAFRLDGLEENNAVVMPITIAVGEFVPRSDVALSVDGSVLPSVAGSRIELETPDAVHDLVDDPSTPKWAGKDDLSATATLAHDGKGLYFAISVRDQTHCAGQTGAKLWCGDSVQIALVMDGKQTEFGLTAAGGGSNFCWMSPDARLINTSPDWPCAVVREGSVTTYRGYVPFSALGGAYRPGTLLRMTFAVNEDDGRGRVRMLKWFDGIHPGKDIRKFGYLVLE